MGHSSLAPPFTPGLTSSVGHWKIYAAASATGEESGESLEISANICYSLMSNIQHSMFVTVDTLLRSLLRSRPSVNILFDTPNR